jgi:hypothetical protein
MSTRKRLGDLLIETRAIDEFQLSSALAHQRQSGGALGRILVDSHFISEDALAQVLSAQLGLPVVNLDEIVIHPTVIETVSVDQAEQLRVLPVRIQQAETRGSVLFLAMSDPTNADAIDTIQFRTGKRVAPMLATESGIERAIRRHYYAEAIQTATIVSNDVQFVGNEFELDDGSAGGAVKGFAGTQNGMTAEDEIPVITGAAVVRPAVDDWMLGGGNPLHLTHASADIGMLELVTGDMVAEDEEPPASMALSSADLASLGLGGDEDIAETRAALFDMSSASRPVTRAPEPPLPPPLPTSPPPRPRVADVAPMPRAAPPEPAAAASPVVAAPPAPPVVTAPPASPVVAAPPTPPVVTAPPAPPVVTAPPASPVVAAPPTPPVVAAPPTPPVVVTAPPTPPVVAAPPTPPVVVTAPPTPPVVVTAPPTPPVVAAPPTPPVVVTAPPAPPVVAAPPAPTVVTAPPAPPASTTGPSSSGPVIDDTFGPPPPNTGFGLSTDSAAFANLLESLPEAASFPARATPDDAANVGDRVTAPVSTPQESPLSVERAVARASFFTESVSEAPSPQKLPAWTARRLDVRDLASLEGQEPGSLHSRAAFADDALFLAGQTNVDARLGLSAFVTPGVDSSIAALVDTFDLNGVPRTGSASLVAGLVVHDWDAPHLVAPGAPPQFGAAPAFDVMPVSGATPGAPLSAEITGATSWQAFAESQIVANRLSLDDNVDTQSLRLRFMEIRGDASDAPIALPTTYEPLLTIRTSDVPPWAPFSARLEASPRPSSISAPVPAPASAMVRPLHDKGVAESEDVARESVLSGAHDDDVRNRSEASGLDLDVSPASLDETSPGTRRAPSPAESLLLHEIDLSPSTSDVDLELELGSTDSDVPLELDSRFGSNALEFDVPGPEGELGSPAFPDLALDDDKKSSREVLALEDVVPASTVELGAHGGRIDVDALALSEFALADDGAPPEPPLDLDLDDGAEAVLPSPPFEVLAPPALAAAAVALPALRATPVAVTPASVPEVVSPPFPPFDELRGLDTLSSVDDAPAATAPRPIDVRALAIPVDEAAVVPVEREALIAAPAFDDVTNPSRALDADAVVPDPASAALDLEWGRFADDDAPMPPPALDAPIDLPATSVDLLPTSLPEAETWGLPTTALEPQDVSSTDVTTSLPEQEALPSDEGRNPFGVVPNDAQLIDEPMGLPTPTMITRLTPDELRILAARLVARGALTREDYEKAKKTPGDDESGES